LTDSVQYNGAPVSDAMLRMQEVKALTGLSRSTIWRMVKGGDFPSPIPIGKRARGWPSGDIARWRSDRANARVMPEAA
jgi:prophage regulatory protein